MLAFNISFKIQNNENTNYKGDFVLKKTVLKFVLKISDIPYSFSKKNI